MDTGSSTLVKLKERFETEHLALRAQLPEKFERFRIAAGKEGLCLDFSKPLDTLFVYLGQSPRQSFTQELLADISVQLDPDDEEIVGFEIENFGLAAARGGSPAFQAFGSTYFTLVHYGKLVLPPGSDAPQTAVQDLYSALLHAA